MAPVPGRRFFFLALAITSAISVFLALHLLYPEVLRHPETTAAIEQEINPVEDAFPAAMRGEIPAILAANTPPTDHPKTPLFIGFTRNWPILQQAVVSYITAGWPPEDIYVVDNSGTMDSNELGLLTLQNPFFVDYPRLRALGVNILTTPTLFTFAQLQNYFLYTSIQHKWGHYWWSHMDSVAVSWEDKEPYKSMYERILEDWKEVEKSGERWALRFFLYDRLALVNVQAYKDVGGWDTMIPFYTTDCDMHSRLELKNYTTPEARVGLVYDVGGSVKDLSSFYPSSPDEPVNSQRYKDLIKELDDIQRFKHDGGGGGRNFWQAQQRGGKGEPFYRDPLGFEKAILMWIDYGKEVFYEKWGHRGCDIITGAHRSFDDQWLVPHDSTWT